MEHETTIGVDAPADRLWAAVVDITAWPRWTASMTSVERLDEGPLRVGSTVRIKQPGMPRLTWTVDALTPGSSFSWSARSPGMVTWAEHAVGPNDAGGGDGGSTLTLRIRQTGPAAGLLGLLTGGRTRRFVQMEADGLKRCAETATETKPEDPSAAR